MKEKNEANEFLNDDNELKLKKVRSKLGPALEQSRDGIASEHDKNIIEFYNSLCRDIRMDNIKEKAESLECSNVDTTNKNEMYSQLHSYTVESICKAVKSAEDVERIIKV